MDVKVPFVSTEDIQRMLGLKGGFGRFVAKCVIKSVELDKANEAHAPCAHLMGPDFARDILKNENITYDIPEDQRDLIPLEGGFITVSNHHFGSIDGLILSDVIRRKRKDYKILTTFLLALVPNLTESFLPVNNWGGKNDARSINSIRMALEHIQSGGGLGLFPAGEVATWQKKGKRNAVSGRHVVEDKPWAPNIIRLIKKSGLPVIPIYFDGGNSLNFHLLGCIHPRLRTVRLIHELFNKKGTHVKVRIGQPITPQEIARFQDTEAFGLYLRNVTYALEAQCKEEPKQSESRVQEPIMDPVDPQLVRSEMERIRDRVLFECGDYRCYLTPPDDIPSTMLELARLRELTFRRVGEGSGMSKDTDIYDAYYKHLILWNIPDGRIAGSYRIGVGPEVVKQPQGIQSFYTASLFKFGKGLDKYIPKVMELGRTIVVPEYQKEVQPLRLLLAGILTAGAQFPNMQYTMGTASISGDMPLFYKSIIVHFFRKNLQPKDAGQCLTPRCPFKPDFLRVNPDALLVNCHTVEDLDRLLLYLSGGKYRLPVLLRKYVSFGSKVLDFNIDPLFNTLDGFVLLWLGDMPENSYRSFSKFLTPEQLEEMNSRLERQEKNS